MCSRLISTTNNAPGRRVISAIEPKFLSSFSRRRFICSFSFLESVSKRPSCFIRSIVCIFFIALRIVTKFVSIPPGHLSVMYGMFAFAALSATISFACFLVATKRIFLPDAAIFLRASPDSSIFAAVL